jgi:hypothetical protein
VPVPSPSLAHGEVDLAAHRASPLSPSAPLLPSTLGVIAGSGPCSARSTAPASVHHGALPLRRRVGQAMPEPISAAGWALPLLLVTPLLPSLPNTITKSRSCGAGSVVPPLVSTAAQVIAWVCPGGPPPIRWSPDLGSTPPDLTLACLVDADSTVNAGRWLVVFGWLATTVAGGARSGGLDPFPAQPPVWSSSVQSHSCRPSSRCPMFCCR